jgi:alpha-glucosidase (family GH31 glycosyl hydrolase)
MKASIADVMQFSMFGIPMTGAAVGGNYGEENPEIVARWIQLSTFMPLARQSRDELKGGKPNEPYNLPKPYSSWARNAIYDRLKYTRQMYTCLFEASLTGKTCFDPLFYHYPENDDLYKNYESTFIVSDALKVSPVLEAVEDPTF